MGCLCTPLEGAAFTAAVYVLGHMSDELLGLVGETGGALLRRLVEAAHLVLPAFETFNVRIRVFLDNPLPPEHLPLATVYAVLYSGVVLLLARAALGRRVL